MKRSTRELTLAATIYTGFFGAIVAAIVITGSAWCLLALLLTPSIKVKDNGKDE